MMVVVIFLEEMATVFQDKTSQVSETLDDWWTMKRWHPAFSDQNPTVFLP